MLGSVAHGDGKAGGAPFAIGVGGAQLYVACDCLVALRQRVARRRERRLGYFETRSEHCNVAWLKVDEVL